MTEVTGKKLSKEEADELLAKNQRATEEAKELQAVMSLLVWGRLYCTNVRGFIHDNQFIIKDLNKSEHDQVLMRAPVQVNNNVAQLQSVRDSIVASKIMEYCRALFTPPKEVASNDTQEPAQQDRAHH